MYTVDLLQFNVVCLECNYFQYSFVCNAFSCNLKNALLREKLDRNYEIDTVYNLVLFSVSRVLLYTRCDNPEPKLSYMFILTWIALLQDDKEKKKQESLEKKQAAKILLEEEMKSIRTSKPESSKLTRSQIIVSTLCHDCVNLLFH